MQSCRVTFACGVDFTVVFRERRANHIFICDCRMRDPTSGGTHGDCTIHLYICMYHTFIHMQKRSVGGNPWSGRRGPCCRTGWDHAVKRQLCGGIRRRSAYISYFCEGATERVARGSTVYCAAERWCLALRARAPEHLCYATRRHPPTQGVRKRKAGAILQFEIVAFSLRRLTLRHHHRTMSTSWVALAVAR